MAGQNSEAAKAAVGSLSEKLSEMIAGESLDYKSWRSLLLEIETASPDDINLISLAYDAFLSKFPLCHWHLEKYAYHKAKLCGAEEAIKVFEQGVGAAMFSVGFWVDYFTFGTACFGDPEDVRRLFGRAYSCVGKDYFCHILWDKYMKYELGQEGWSFLAESYIQALRFPTKKLQLYYDNFKQFVANLEEEMEYENNHFMEVEQASVPSAAIKIKVSRDEISVIIKDLLDPSDRPLRFKALDRYRSIGEEFYREARCLDEKIKCFEANIQRRYFYASPLDDGQLDNWHLYLDFVEKQSNLDWAVKLYERCLIPCANYPEFWMRYVEFLESKGGRELAVAVLDRSTEVFLKNVPEIHLFNARFKERIGDANGAHAAFLLYSIKSDSSFIDNIVTQANMERRLGNFRTASAIYETALKAAIEKQRLHILPSLYSHFARLTFVITGNADAARDVLIDGIRQVPRSRFLLEELIKFAMMHGGETQVNAVDLIIADAISPGQNEYECLNAKDREAISWLYLEFVDLCGTVYDIRKAWLRHVKLFPRFLRSRPMYKHFTLGRCSSDVIGDKKGSHNLPIYNQPTNNKYSDHSMQVKVQEQILEPQMNQENHLCEVSEMQSSQKDHNNNLSEKVLGLATKIVVPSNEDADGDKEPPAQDLSCQSREDELGDVGAKLANLSEQNAFSVNELAPDLTFQYGDDRPGLMDVTSESGTLSKENALSPRESVHEFGKSSGAIEPVEVPEACETDVHHELACEPKPENQIVSLDHKFLKSHEKESLKLGLVASDELETKRKGPVSSSSTPPGISTDNTNFIASPKDLQTFEHPQLHNKSEREELLHPQNNTPKESRVNSEKHSRTCVESIQKDHMATASTHSSSGLHDLSQNQEHQLQQCLQGRSEAQRGAIQKDKTSDQTQPARMMTPSSDMSRGQSPLSTPPVSYTQENMQQLALAAGQHQGQMHHNQAMNQMLQYHYQQQHFMQQQYQQSYLQMQQYYMNQQQPSQLHPEQQNQYMLQQQHYVQPLPSQLQQQFQQPQQQLQQQQIQQMVGHVQSQPHPDYQHAQEKQHPQSQELAYNMHELGYQQLAAQRQQMFLQQYQQYQQNYQHMQQQQQSMVQNQQDGQLQQHQQHIDSDHNSRKDASQNQQVRKRASPDYDSAAAPSESPHLRVQSP